MKLEKYFSKHDVNKALEAMAYYAKSQCNSLEVTNLVERLFPGDNKKNFSFVFFTIRDYIINNMQYVTDGDESKLLGFDGSDLELIKSPKAILETNRYDCDCASTLIASVLLNLGIPVRFVVISTINEPNSWTHVYAEGYDSKEKIWIIVDPVSYPHEKQMVLDTKQHKIYNLI
jgi:hypothetical protein